MIFKKYKDEGKYSKEKIKNKCDRYDSKLIKIIAIYQNPQNRKIKSTIYSSTCPYPSNIAILSPLFYVASILILISCVDIVWISISFDLLI